MSKDFKTTGIILRKFNLNEADRILSVLTADMGKIECIAKGARKIKSKFTGRVEMFNQVEITCHKGRTLENLKEVDIISSQSICSMTLETHSTLFYIAEITNQLIQEGQQVDGAYELLEDTLKTLQNSEDCEAVLHAYLIKMFTLLGFMSPWDHCAISGERLDIEKPVFLSLAYGSAISVGYQTEKDPRLPAPMVKWINFMQKYPMEAILKVKSTPGERRQAWRLIELIMQNILHKPLKSESFLQRIRLNR